MFSDNLRAARQARGISQEELASRLHVVRQTVSKWEQGRSVPDADMLVRISEVLETSVAQLLDSTAAEPESAEQELTETLATQLAQLNEQLAIQNRRRHRIWTTIGIVLAVLLFLIVGACVLGMRVYAVDPGSIQGSSSEITGAILR